MNDLEITEPNVKELQAFLGMEYGDLASPAENRLAWLKLGKEIGILEGLFTAKRKALICILRERFAPPDKEVMEYIDMATLPDLDKYILRAATAFTRWEPFMGAASSLARKQS